MHHGADTAAQRHFGAHAVRPEAVDLAFLEGLGSGHAEIDAGAKRAGHRRNGHVVAYKIDSGGCQKAAQAFVDPGRRTDTAAFDDGEIAAFGAEIGMHDEKPIHALGLRADELCALKAWKRGERRMRRAADKIDRAVAQRRIGLIDRKDQFEFDIEPLGLEEAKLDRGLGRKIGIGYHVGHGELHEPVLHFW